MDLTLLVLAAGLGSRYGGMKQVEPVGPSGEILLDYAVYDALAAGFSRLAFVIRPEVAGIFRERIAAKYAGRAAIEMVMQSPASGRERPWGTGHAVLCAAGKIGGSFAVINADDYYGADSFARMAEFFSRPAANAPVPEHFALVGFRLGRTLSEHGAVSRGICIVVDGRLQAVVERKGIAAADVGPGRPYRGDEIVSMNCWAFRPGLFPLLEAQWRSFLEQSSGDPAAEFYLPAAVSSLISLGQASVEVLPTTAEWFGLTYRADQPRAAAAIAGLVAQGRYPSPLFG
jgi:hypothetical protein